jgi:methylthioribose-1-phosphate isomerase
MNVLEWTGDQLLILDQTKLPQSEEVISCSELEQVCEAIESLRIRGAPSLGVTAAYAVLLGAKNLSAGDEDSLLSGIDAICDRVRSTRPTAVNLFWGVEEVRKVALRSEGTGSESILRSMEIRAREIETDNAERHRALCEFGADLIRDGATVLHHCETGPLATVEYGSALGIIHAAHLQGKRIHAFVDETRPLLQGARLTAWELQRWEVPYTLITDSMAGHFMSRGKIDMAIVGADRIAANGDTANKIGTYSAAVLAKHHDIPFYVAAPLTSIDFDTPTGSEIEIEERHGDEVRGFGGRLWAADDATVANPAFDVTPGDLIAGIVTEAGIAEPPFKESLARLNYPAVSVA